MSARTQGATGSSGWRRSTTSSSPTGVFSLWLTLMAPGSPGEEQPNTSNCSELLPASLTWVGQSAVEAAAAPAAATPCPDHPDTATTRITVPSQTPGSSLPPPARGAVPTIVFLQYTRSQARTSPVTMTSRCWETRRQPADTSIA